MTTHGECIVMHIVMEGPDVGIGHLTRCGMKYTHASVPMGMQIMCVVLHPICYATSCLRVLMVKLNFKVSIKRTTFSYLGCG